MVPYTGQITVLIFIRQESSTDSSEIHRVLEQIQHLNVSKTFSFSLKELLSPTPQKNQQENISAFIIPHSQWVTRELLLIWASSGCSWLCLLLSLWAADSAILHMSVLTLQLVNEGKFSKRSKGSKSRNMQVLFQTSILCLVF